MPTYRIRTTFEQQLKRHQDMKVAHERLKEMRKLLEGINGVTT
jgi:hypothetical protein